MEVMLSDMPAVHLECTGFLHPVLPENELLHGFSENDSLSLHQLYATYAGALLGIISKLIKYEDLAEDILQESFVKIWKSIDKYDPGKGRVFTWMARIARNTAIDYLRGQACSKNLKTTDIDVISPYVDKNNAIQLNTDTIGIKELINILPQAQRDILDLVYFQGYTQVEVAERLQIPLGSVKSKIRYAILVLRGRF